MKVSIEVLYTKDFSNVPVMVSFAGGGKAMQSVSVHRRIDKKAIYEFSEDFITFRQVMPWTRC